MFDRARLGAREIEANKRKIKRKKRLGKNKEKELIVGFIL